LLSTDFDGAIVDLNLSSGDPTETSGNEVLREITEKHRFPVLVVSGNLQNLDNRIQQSGFLKTFDRDTPNNEIFKYLLKIQATGITRILGGRGLIERHLGEIFWKHLACDFDGWDTGARDSEKTLLRYVVAHLSEYLDLPSGAANEYYHEAEVYVVPPIREYIATGDIVEKNGSRFILLSPPCDVAVRGIKEGIPVINAKTLLLAPLLPIARETFLENSLITEGGNKDNAKGRESLLNEIIKGKIEKYVFLTAHRNLGPVIADLQALRSWSLSDYLASKRLATVTSPFLKDIQSKFAAYYGRQGQPDLDKKELVRKCKGKLKPPE